MSKLTLKKVIDNFDISIIVNYSVHTKDFLKKNQKICSANGIEVILIFDKYEKVLVDDIISCYPNLNFVYITIENHFKLNFVQKINIYKNYCSREFILISSNVLKISFEKLYDLKFYSSFYIEHHLLEITKCNDILILLNNKLLNKKKFKTCRELSIHILSNKLNIGNTESCLNSAVESYILENENNSPCPNHYLNYTWKNKQFCSEHFENYLTKLGVKKYFYNNHLLKHGKKRLVILIQIFNEENHIAEFIKSWESKCDGIIMLDDGSTDDSFNKFNSSKLLCKIRTQRNRKFNDLKNRNLLLKLASFFDVETFLFLDADEFSYCKHFKIPFEIIKNNRLFIGGIYIVNEWEDGFYNKNLPDTNRYSHEGLWVRWRLFKNIGFCQINENRTLHFPIIPYHQNFHLLRLLIVHRGYLGSDKRTKKNKFYEADDIRFNSNMNSIYFNDCIKAELIPISEIPSHKVAYKKIQC